MCCLSCVLSAVRAVRAVQAEHNKGRFAATVIKQEIIADSQYQRALVLHVLQHLDSCIRFASGKSLVPRVGGLSRQDPICVSTSWSSGQYR